MLAATLPEASSSAGAPAGEQTLPFSSRLYSMRSAMINRTSSRGVVAARASMALPSQAGNLLD